jgi:1-phosphofructokinase family hexose kinase
MILTVTPNPTLDRAIFVRGFQMGAINRADAEILTPSGKGVDVSLVLHALGYPTLATGLQAGQQGQFACTLLDQRGIAHDFVWADGETRHALVLIDTAARQQSTISAATLRANPTHLEALAARIDRYLPEAHFVVFAGSLPPGWPTESYQYLIGRCQAAGHACLLDTSGAALAAVLGAGSGTMPTIIKVNLGEFLAACRTIGLPMPTHQWAAQLRDTDRIADVRAELGLVITQACRATQVAALVVTLGSHGAIAATPHSTWHAQPPLVTAVNDAGAGDALAAGIAAILAKRGTWPEALRLGTAAAAAAVTTPGTAECDPALVAAFLPQVVLTELTQ